MDGQMGEAWLKGRLDTAVGIWIMNKFGIQMVESSLLVEWFILRMAPEYQTFSSLTKWTLIKWLLIVQMVWILVCYSEACYHDSKHMNNKPFDYR